MIFFKKPPESKNGIGIYIPEKEIKLMMEELSDCENGDQYRWFITVIFWQTTRGFYVDVVEEEELISYVINYLEALYLWWKELKEKEAKLLEEINQKHNKINHTTFNIKKGK